MSNTQKGIIKLIADTKQVTDSFKIRKFSIETPGEYPQEILCQCANDKTDLLDNYAVGQEITIHFDLRGRRNNEGKLFNPNVNVWKIEGATVAAPAETEQTPF